MNDEWDYEHEGEEHYAHPALTPWLIFWYDLQILAIMVALVARWVVLMGAQGVEAEMGFSWQKPDGPVRERHYRLNLPGWLC